MRPCVRYLVNLTLTGMNCNNYYLNDIIGWLSAYTRTYKDVVQSKREMLKWLIFVKAL